MSGRESVVFLSSTNKIQEVLISENLSIIDIANSLYQSNGIISLDDISQLNAIEDEKKKAQYLMSLLQQIISKEESQFEQIAKVFTSNDKLKPCIDEMKEKICESENM